MTIDEIWSPVADGSSVQRVFLTFTADKSFIEHVSVGLVQKVRDGPWQKGLNGRSIYPRA